ncbi:hypothetical protein [Agrobacterium sp. P15N1-A]|uniref:hypothetical protein n=1 Tax=Agrobacterium sp. P15N1-A TaxID=3342820 RepID=UPI0037CE453E
MKNCLSNVAEIARNHDIFGPIDERIWDRVQAVSDFYTAFRGNIGKLRINVENGGAFTFPSSRKTALTGPNRRPLSSRRLSTGWGRRLSMSCSALILPQRKKGFCLVGIYTKTNPLVLNGATRRRPVFRF